MFLYSVSALDEIALAIVSRIVRCTMVQRTIRSNVHPIERTGIVLNLINVDEAAVLADTVPHRGIRDVGISLTHW
jgi:hypothetical protein